MKCIKTTVVNSLTKFYTKGKCRVINKEIQDKEIIEFCLMQTIDLGYLRMLSDCLRKNFPIM